MTLGTLSSGNAEGDREAATCEKTKERIPLCENSQTLYRIEQY